MTKPDVRETMLRIVVELGTKDIVFSTDVAIDKAATELEARDRDTQHAILDAWHDLYRTGIVSFGMNLNHGPNRSSDWARLTTLGKKIAENVSRDPSNPRGYLAHIETIVPAGTVARSYIEEAVRTHAVACDKATAVLVGAASEALILELRDTFVAKMKALAKPVPKELEDWKVKKVADAIEDAIALVKKDVPKNLWEKFESYWGPFVGYLRMSRNDAGHPKSINPVTRESVHAMLLVFPEQAALAVALTEWVTSKYA